jgi:hypothetical protein
MKTTFLIAAAAGALLFSDAAVAQTQPQQHGDVLQQLFGAIFGADEQANERELESDWNAGRRPFAQRRERLEARIDAAVRDGSLNRREADQMRREYNEIVRLEADYSANGRMSPQQRSDLRTRYRALSQRIGGQGAQTPDQSDGRWQPLAQRSRDFEQKLALGLRNRTLNQREAAQLRADWRALAQVEARYQRGGIDQREQADLWARYNAIEYRLGGADDRARWTRLETQLATAERNRSITPAEAVQVRAQLSDLTRLDAAYATGGYTADERSYLTRRHGELDALLRQSRPRR